MMFFWMSANTIFPNFDQFFDGKCIFTDVRFASDLGKVLFFKHFHFQLKSQNAKILQQCVRNCGFVFIHLEHVFLGDPGAREHSLESCQEIPPKNTQLHNYTHSRSLPLFPLAFFVILFNGSSVFSFTPNYPILDALTSGETKCCLF